ncbi:MAG: hypothetical protein KGZ68_16835 [Dechloromonas sp.]|nr:hypothetical protein [Dechloromonas sp.]
MIWLLTKVFSPLAPIFHFIGDHRYGSIAVLLIVAAAAAWVYVPVAGRKIAGGLIVAAVAAGFFDWGYSYRAAIDRKAWAQAEKARADAEEKEEKRREDAVDSAATWAREEARRLASEEENRAKQSKEIDDAARNSHRPGLSLPFVLQLGKIR